jgi:peptide-methionine (R)-S-oxide reductase
MIARRTLLLSGAAALAATLSSPLHAAERFQVKYTDVQWRKRLTRGQYLVLRKSMTEKAYSHPLLEEKRAGMFACAGCDQDLFSSKVKYDSHTGWPSFWQPLDPKVLGSKPDRYRSEEELRVEVHCSRCGGHLGHVFNDGPPPTGQRYCINGLALTFKPEAGA